MARANSDSSADKQSPATEVDPRGLSATAIRDRSGERIGNYHLLDLIGSGGFGDVYAAEQTSPVKRRVALKVLKAGMDTKAVLARFEQERQALALMNHPHVAKILDAGATPGGRPYFVMELVQGQSITEYCDKHRLNTVARLKLFIQVCQAVQHAHQKGIIHRDLKPSNVLIALTDGEPSAKVIDFGIAKATAGSLSDLTLYTRQGELIGTPAYMSPEQLNGEDIDTRTDIYALGVVLFEMLTGRLPFDANKLKRRGLDAFRQVITEDPPPKPSSQVSNPDSESTARRRRTDPKTLNRMLKGELDWIVLKAMEKDRSRRYESASGLASDIRRHINREPVAAGPPSARYRLWKFAQRHRIGLTAAFAIAITVVGALILSNIQRIRVEQARDQLQVAEARAQQEARSAEAISDFLIGLFEVADPGEAKGSSITAREILDKGAKEISEDSTTNPTTRAVLMRTMGRVYVNLGLTEPARTLLEQALQIETARLGPESTEAATTLTELAHLLSVAGEADAAVERAQQALKILEARYGPGHEQVAHALNALGNAFSNQGALGDAITTHRRALTIRESRPQIDDEAVSQSTHNLANAYLMNGQSELAIPLYERSIAIHERTSLDPESDYELATSLHVLAIALQDRSEFEQALALEERALRIREKVLGPDHWHVMLSLTTKGTLLRNLERVSQSEAPLRRASEIGIAALGIDHGEVMWAQGHLVETLMALGKYAEARQRLEMMEAVRGAEDAQLQARFGKVALGEGSFANALEYFSRSLALDEKDFGDAHAYLIPALKGKGDALRGLNRSTEALISYQRAMDILGSDFNSARPSHVELAQAIANLEVAQSGEPAGG